MHVPIHTHTPISSEDPCVKAAIAPPRDHMHTLIRTYMHVRIALTSSEDRYSRIATALPRDHMHTVMHTCMHAFIHLHSQAQRIDIRK
jgi:hypothetical protein